MCTTYVHALAATLWRVVEPAVDRYYVIGPVGETARVLERDERRGDVLLRLRRDFRSVLEHHNVHNHPSAPLSVWIHHTMDKVIYLLCGWAKSEWGCAEGGVEQADGRECRERETQSEGERRERERQHGVVVRGYKYRKEGPA